jgi:glutathione S-transferase
MLKLYTYHNSICTQKALITLDEKGLPFETQYVDLFKNEQFQPWYLAVNPKGVVPALDHDGRIVTESTLICEYLDEIFPDPPLVPADPHARTLMRQWSKRVDEYLFDATRELSFSAMFREKMRNMTAEEREGRYRNTGDPIKRARLMSTYELGAESPYVFQGVGAFELAFKAMERDLADLGGSFLLGADMTLADINMIPFVARLHFLNILDLWLPERPLVQGWFDRMREMPSFKRNIVERLTPGDYDSMHKFGTRIREQVRQQRDSYLAQFA